MVSFSFLKNAAMKVRKEKPFGRFRAVGVSSNMKYEQQFMIVCYAHRCDTEQTSIKTSRLDTQRFFSENALHENHWRNALKQTSGMRREFMC